MAKNTTVTIRPLETVQHVSFSEVIYSREKTRYGHPKTSMLYQAHDTKTDTYQLLNEEEFELMKGDIVDPGAKVRRQSVRKTLSRPRLGIATALAASFAGVGAMGTGRGGRR